MRKFIRGFFFGLFVALIFLRATANDLCGNGVVDDGEECDNVEDKCCVSCRLRTCDSTSTCLQSPGVCDPKTGFCGFKPLGEGDFCWIGNCLSACVDGNCIPLDRASQSACAVLERAEAMNVYIVSTSGRIEKAFLDACRQRVIKLVEKNDNIQLKQIALPNTQRPFFVSNSTVQTHGTSETISTESISLSTVTEAMSLINSVHSTNFPIPKGVIESSKRMGIEVFWVTDTVEDSDKAHLLISPPLTYHLRIVDSLEAAYATSKFFAGDATEDIAKRSNSNYCTSDNQCKFLTDDCNEGVCANGKCESRPNIFYPNGQRRACMNDDKCALEARCFLKGSGQEKGVCVTTQTRDCSCLDDLDECEIGYCNPKNGKCYGKKTDDCGYYGSCPPGAECDPAHPCCDSITCKWKPVESTCAKKAGYFDNMDQEEILCVNNYCTRNHECKIFPIAENNKCFDLRPNFRCRQGACIRDED